MQSRNLPINIILVALILFVLSVYSYATMRFVGAWNENDTMVLTITINSVYQSDSLLNTEIPYGNGLTYQSIALFVMELSGVSIQVLQTYVFPCIASLVPLMAFVTYRTLLQNNTAALLGTLILYVQPDFLFVTWRGSHEKITWNLVLFLLFILAKSFSARGDRGLLTRYMGLFYIVAFAFICSNAFFASSFVAALVLSCIAGFTLLAIRDRRHYLTSNWTRAHIRRMLFITLSCAIFLYLFFFHLYPPATGLLAAFRSLVEGLQALFLNQESGVNPYSYVTAAWIDGRIYLLLTGLSFLVLGLSGLVWLAGVPGFLNKRDVPSERLPRLFLWMIYPAFAAQLVLSVFADRADAVGSNLQVRLFTPLMMVAIPLVSLGALTLLGRIRRTSVRRMVLAVGAFGFACASVFALFKATNEPVLSNIWVFTTEAEREAGVWTAEHSENPQVWVGNDLRLRAGVVFNNLDVPQQTFRSSVRLREWMDFYIWSDIERARWARLRLPHVYLEEELLVYDNGSTQVYHRRPRSPYQR